MVFLNIFPGDDYDAWKALASWGYKWSIYLAFCAVLVGFVSALFLLYRFYAQGRMEDLKDAKQGEKLIAILEYPPSNYESIYAQILPLNVPGSQYSRYKSLLDRASQFPALTADQNRILAGALTPSDLFVIDTYTFLVRKFPVEFFQDTGLINIANTDSNSKKRNYYSTLSKDNLIKVISTLRKLAEETTWTPQHLKTVHFMLTAMCGDNGIFLPEFKQRFTHEQISKISTSWTEDELSQLDEYIRNQLIAHGLLTLPK